MFLGTSSRDLKNNDGRVSACDPSALNVLGEVGEATQETAQALKEEGNGNDTMVMVDRDVVGIGGSAGCVFPDPTVMGRLLSDAGVLASMMDHYTDEEGSRTGSISERAVNPSTGVEVQDKSTEEVPRVHDNYSVTKEREVEGNEGDTVTTENGTEERIDELEVEEEAVVVSTQETTAEGGTETRARHLDDDRNPAAMFIGKDGAVSSSGYPPASTASVDEMFILGV